MIEMFESKYSKHLTENATRYRIVDTENNQGKIYVSVESYGDTDNSDTQLQTFEETELCNLCMHRKDYKDSKVDLRKT